ncbi:hypothetical protein LTR16_000244 [Cryomyces antarcticus]|uniref:Uncharacterized protein n=1 Tax=Cryomyces antarcticus TaxID=329879 RepID=A0ABR0KUT8_9PEZI|nr:hypothetical protein LTR60_002714 [Cryomyces antarcticus]KAK5131968.1 hypothetical protein LTR16_000244 [Cryomyces antarcticus]
MICTYYPAFAEAVRSSTAKETLAWECFVRNQDRYDAELVRPKLVGVGQQANLWMLFSRRDGVWHRFDTQATFDGTPTEKKLIANESSENKPSTDNTKDQERSEASNGIHAQPIPEDFIKASAASVS